MNLTRKTALALAAGLLALPALAQITFYEHDGYRGRTFTAEGAVSDFRNSGFNDRASSVVVQGGNWEVCENTQFGGRCVVLRPGNYASLSSMGLNDDLSSTRPVDRRHAEYDQGPPPMDAEPYAYRRRPNERIYEVPVTSVHAVVGEPTEQCWIERHQVASGGGGGSSIDPTRTLIGAVIGGVLGHQIGNGRGRDLATAGGAVAGGAIGANIGRSQETTSMQDVRRCRSVASTVPTYWDVTYEFRGVNHRMQMNSDPGRTVSVNRHGEPRQ